MKKLLVVAGPSGAGKTYLARLLMERDPSVFSQGQLYTTRQPRPDEPTTDRLFVSKEEFQRKEHDGDFFITGEFHDNLYGYPRTLLDIDEGKCVIINTWPQLVPEFVGLDDVMFLGLTVDNALGIPLLRQRMKKRDYTPAQMEERLELVRRDVADLHSVADLIVARGRLFTIEDDTTIPEEIIPWIERSLES